MTGRNTRSGQAYGLSVFVAAQNKKNAGFIEAMSELLNEKKTGHWVWYIFPQIQGISVSANGRKFAIKSLEHARAYLENEPLGYRLGQAVQILHNATEKDAKALMGTEVDASKLQACMTLFHHVAKDEDKDIFQFVLDKYFEGKTHEKTDEILLALQ